MMHGHGPEPRRSHRARVRIVLSDDLEWRNASPLPDGKSLWIFRYSQERRRIERYADQGPTSVM